jgi:hypothetical protein
MMQFMKKILIGLVLFLTFNIFSMCQAEAFWCLYRSQTAPGEVCGEGGTAAGYTCFEYPDETLVCGAQSGYRNATFRQHSTELECYQDANVVNNLKPAFCVYEKSGTLGNPYSDAYICEVTTCDEQLLGVGRGECKSDFQENGNWSRTRYGSQTHDNLADCVAEATNLNNGGDGDDGGLTFGTAKNPWEILRGMNPLQGVCGGKITLGCLVSTIVNGIVFPIATLLLFLMIVWGGYQMVMGSFSCHANIVELGRRRVVGAVLGYVLLGVSFWLWLVVESVLHLKIT